MSQSVFTYSEEVAERFPAARAQVVVVRDVFNDKQVRALAAVCQTMQVEAADRLADTAPAELPSIKAWRQVFSAMGVKPTQHRNAAEALLRRLLRHGDIPSISPLVDMGNSVSVTHALPVAVFDLDSVSSPITVIPATGDETFLGIGAAEPEHPAPGEVIFVDANGDVAARRWCWKQGANAATKPGTTTALFVIEAVHEGAAEATAAAGDQLLAMISQHFPQASTQRFAVSA